MSQTNNSKTETTGTIWKVVIVLSLAALVFLFWFHQKTARNTQNSTAPILESSPVEPSVDSPKPPAPDPAPTRMDVLSGRWQRPDGGYVIDIRQINEDGTLDAEYFNPRSIRVEEARATIDGDKLTVFIKLQDQGYPGSTYTLLYDLENDILQGTYFQAAYQQNYHVFFTRMEE